MMNPTQACIGSVTALRPLDSDPATALAFARRAILARNEGDAETSTFLSMVERDVANGSATGVLRTDGDRVVGIALWEPPSALGTTLQVLFTVEGDQTPSEYSSFFSEIVAATGPIVFAPGILVGLDETQEGEVMRGLGYARFSRSEMRYPPERPPPDLPADAPPGLREARVEDLPALARVHELAYRDHFDRYLFLTDPDPFRDAEKTMGEVVGGRWGEFLPWASAVVEGDGGLVAATLVVRQSYGPLIADVMVAPARQGSGLGRSVVVASIRALRARGESVIVLNVTEGNAHALRLYQKLGFARSLGPSHGWYSTERIPVSPDSR